jgi:tetratricopeptide (TPR) repeat protein
VLVWFRNWEWARPLVFWKKSAARGLKGISFHNLGIEYKRRGDLDKAQNFFEKSLRIAIAKKSKAGENLVKSNLALLCFEQGRLDEAKKMAEEVINSGFFYPSVYYILGKILEMEGKEEEALKLWNEARRRLPFFWGINKILGKFYFQRKDFYRAEAYLWKVIETNPGDWEAYLLLGKIMEEKDPISAINMYKKSISLRPSYYYSHFLLGMAYVEKKEYISALEELMKAINLNPKYAPAYYNAAIIYAIFSQKKEARIFLEKASRLGYKVPLSLKRKIIIDEKR